MYTLTSFRSVPSFAIGHVRDLRVRWALEEAGQTYAMRLVGFDDTMARHRVVLWLSQVAAQANVVARNNSVLGLVYSARAGMGLAALPVAIADADADLVRVLGPIESLNRIWRVLTTPQLRHVPRVAAFFDFVVEETEALRPILTG